MRIGVDAKNLCGSLSGISRYVLNMVQALACNGVEIMLFAPRNMTLAEFDHPNITLKADNFSGRLGGMFWSQFVLPERIRASDIDLFWGPAHRLPLFPLGVPCVLTIHDLVWKRYPETMSALGLQGEKLLMPRAIGKADRIVCMSKFTAADVALEFPDASSRCQTIYPGLTRPVEANHAATQKSKQPFMLFVGTNEPRKNLESLLRAYAELNPMQKQKCHLRIIGASGWKQGHLKELANQLDISRFVHWSGFVDDAELEQSYKAAKFLVLPSLFEGFGLPIIEAQKYATPVLTSNVSAMPEVAGRGALFADPHDYQTIRAAMARLIDEPLLRADLGRRARENSNRFAWQNAAIEFELLCKNLLIEKGKSVESIAFLQNT